MRVTWRRLAEHEIDHEVLWSGVLGACALAGALMLVTAGIPQLECAVKAATGVPCPTCGFGRSIMALWQGELAAATRWNPLVPLSATCSGIYAVYAGIAVATGPKRVRLLLTSRQVRFLRWSVAFGLIAVWTWLLVDGR